MSDHSVKNAIIFIGYYYPQKYFEDNMEKFYLVPFASNRLQEGVLKGFQEVENIDLKIFSFLPTTEYPKSKFLFAKSEKNLFLGNTKIKTIPFINLIFIKHFTKGLFLLIYLLKTLITTKAPKTIFVYNLNSVIVLIINFLSFIFTFKKAVIIADMPMAAMPNENIVIQKLRNLDRWYIIKGLKKMNGLVVLTKHIITDFFSDTKNVVVEGMISNTLLDYYKNKEIKYSNNELTTFTFIGRLSSFQNVDGMIREFMKTTRTDIRLVLCGKGELDSFIKESAEKDSRIIYKGFVSNEELPLIVEQTNYFISPKKVDEYFSKYSFPSKIIEYMITGKPTLSFQLPGIPDNYFNYIISLDDKIGMFEFFNNSTHDNDAHRSIGDKAKSFIVNEKSVKIQTAQISNFINQL